METRITSESIWQISDHLGNNRLSYADANGNGKIDTPSSTAVTVWKDDFEDKSKANNDWDGSGNSWGWPITDIVSNKGNVPKMLVGVL